MLAAIGVAFFMLKDEIDQVRRAVNTVNQLEERLHKMEGTLNNLNIRFEQEKEETEKFKAQATKTIFDIVKSMGVR